MIERLQAIDKIVPEAGPITTTAFPQKGGDLQLDIIDYRVSLNQTTAETIIYNRSALSTSQPLIDSPDFGDLLSRLLARQGITYSEASGGKSVEIDPKAKAEAQALISEDGYWGVEKTSERIFKFAIVGVAKNPENLAKIKAAVNKGFDLAAKALGGTLPEISTKTHEAVLEKLDKWANQGSLT
jgi:hypothetical protein